MIHFYTIEELLLVKEDIFMFKSYCDSNYFPLLLLCEYMSLRSSVWSAHLCSFTPEIIVVLMNARSFLSICMMSTFCTLRLHWTGCDVALCIRPPPTLMGTNIQQWQGVKENTKTMKTQHPFALQHLVVQQIVICMTDYSPYYPYFF